MKKAPCSIRVDREGVWYHEGREITRGEIIEYFFQHLGLDRDGNYTIEAEGNLCALDVEDTPFVVSHVERRSSDATGEAQILLRFRHLSSVEALDPETLHVGAENVLYCRIRNGSFLGRFSRPAYYQLAEWIQEDTETGAYFVELNGKRHVIRRDRNTH